MLGLVAYFADVGLTDASEVATIVGALAGVAALAVAVWGLFPQKTTRIQNITAGNDAYVSGNNLTVNQPPHTLDPRTGDSQGGSPAEFTGQERPGDPTQP